MRDKQKIALELPDQSCRSLLWFQSSNVHELLWSAYGPSSKQSTIVFDWPELNLPDECNHTDILASQPISCKFPIDHLISHRDGELHIKGSKELPDDLKYIHTMRKMTPTGTDSCLVCDCLMLLNLSVYRAAEPLKANIPPHRIQTGTQDAIACWFTVFFARDEMPDDMRQELAAGRWMQGPAIPVGKFRIYSVLKPALSCNFPVLIQQSFCREAPVAAILIMRFFLHTGLTRVKAFAIR